MQSLDERVLERLDGLIAEGGEILETAEWDGAAETSWVNVPSYAAWQARCAAFFSDVFPGHVYGAHLLTTLQGPEVDVIERALAILRAVRKDVVQGYLTKMGELIHADMFADFLEMAQYLLSEGYKDAAAVMIGSVLEEHLRQLCRKHGIDIERQTSDGPKPKKADVMNADLAKQKVYSMLEQKQVTAWLDLRNKAAHGKYEDYAREHVELMLMGIQGFIGRLPA